MYAILKTNFELVTASSNMSLKLAMGRVFYFRFDAGLIIKYDDGS